MQRKCILVTGGAGYIGSYMNEKLYQSGYDTVVLDNLSEGFPQAVQHGIFIEGDICDSELLNRIFTTHRIDAVMHFASSLSVGESVINPLKYYKNNVAGTITLLEAMLRHQIKLLIFSSSCTIFGIPKAIPISENHACSPISPYGQSKLMVENILKDVSQTGELRYCSLRYFNASGGDPAGKLKNYKTKEATLIPVVLRSLKEGSVVTIFGTDYPTPDGTCIRDYIHIEDIADAHIKAMEKLFQGAPSSPYNLGNGKGFSVKEIIAAVEKLLNRNVLVSEGPRRPGDPAILIADASKAHLELDWKPKYPSIESIIQHAWQSLIFDPKNGSSR